MAAGALVVWLIGFVATGTKAAVLYVTASEMGEKSWAIVTASLLGGLGGAVKGRTVFLHLARRNVQRIRNTPRPTLKDMYRVQFYFFLATMVITFAVLSRVFAKNGVVLLVLGALDTTVSVALLVSCAPLYHLARGSVHDDNDLASEGVVLVPDATVSSGAIKKTAAV